MVGTTTKGDVILNIDGSRESIDAWRQYVASKYAAIEIVPQGVCVGATLSVGVRYLHIGNGLSQNRRCV